MITRSYSVSRAKQTIELSVEERRQLNTIIDLLIPSDQDFPPPSSLHLIDEVLQHLLPGAGLMLNEKHLRAVMRDLNASAGGNFCHISMETQQALLRHLEQREPATFQALWTLANHSYYTRLAILTLPGTNQFSTTHP
jgi:Gluconate 2-dehydrogenase subunit 3